MDTPPFTTSPSEETETKQSIPKHKLHSPRYIHYYPYALSTPQTCPKVVPDVTTITVPNAILVDADGSTNPSVTALPTPTSVRSTMCEGEQDAAERAFRKQQVSVIPPSSRQNEKGRGKKGQGKKFQGRKKR
jgi:hypothetical protein